MNASGDGGGQITQLRPPGGPQEPPPVNPGLAAKIDAVRQRVFDVMADVSVMAASFSRDVKVGQPEYGHVLDRLYRELDTIAGELDESEIERAVGEACNAAPERAG